MIRIPRARSCPSTVSAKSESLQVVERVGLREISRGFLVILKVSRLRSRYMEFLDKAPPHSRIGDLRAVDLVHEVHAVHGGHRPAAVTLLDPVDRLQNLNVVPALAHDHPFEVSSLSEWQGR